MISYHFLGGRRRQLPVSLIWRQLGGRAGIYLPIYASGGADSGGSAGLSGDLGRSDER